MRASQSKRPLTGSTFAALMVSTAAYLVLSNPAMAQSAPDGVPGVRPLSDANGVNPATGQLELSVPEVSVGVPGRSGLTHTRYWANNYWRHGYTMYAIVKLRPQTQIVYVTVVMGNMSKVFPFPGGTYPGTVSSSPQGDGATLTVGPNSTWIYTQADGTAVTFDSSILAPGGSTNHYYESMASNLRPSALATEISKPNGEKIKLTYKVTASGSDWLVYLLSVNSNYGLQLKYEHENGDLQVTKVTGINNAVDYCDPAADTCTSLTQAWPYIAYNRSYTSTTGTETATDNLGRQTRYSYVKNPLAITLPGYSITGIKYPSSSTDNVTIAYVAPTSGLAPPVSSYTNDKGTWTYSLSKSGTVSTMTVTNPLSQTSTVVSNNSSIRVTSQTDALNRTTTSTLDSYGRVIEVRYPEGNKTQFTYDARGNVTQTRQISKTPGTPADIVTTFNFDATCTLLAKCNRPNYMIDPKGNQTDYTYDSTHGGLLKVMRPAPTGGATRPEVRIAYVQKQAYYNKTGSGIVASGLPIYLPTNVSACQNNASCVGTADESVSTIDYGPQTGVANNLFPVSQTLAAGNGSVATSQSYTYDIVGNKTTVDGPLSGSADTTRLRYDGGRQLIGVVGPDPDGGGPRKHLAKRVAYNADGRILTKETGTVDSQSDADWAAMTVQDTVSFEYDAGGRRTKAQLSGGGTTIAVQQNSYDSLGRVDCIAIRMNPAIFGSLPTSACTVGSAGSGVNDFGPDRIAKNTYDAAGQLTKTQTAFGTGDQADEVTTGYTNNGQVAYVSDAESNKTAYTYDGHDRLVKTEYPSSTKGANTVNSSDYEQLGYDANGNVISRRLRDGNSIGYGYDNLNRLTSKDLPGSEPDAVYSYDLQNHHIAAIQGGQTVGFTYDALGRNLTQSGPLGTVGYGYDAAGRRTSMAYPGGTSLTVNYDYDTAGNVTAIKENGSTLLATYAYDNLGRPSSVTFGNGVVQSYGFDAASRLSSLGSDLSGSGNDQTATFAYNPASQIDSLTKSNDGYAWNGHYNVDRVNATNGLNQLAATTPGGGQVTLPMMGYDAKGNLTSSGSGSTYSYSSENFLTGAFGTVSLTYDPVGRLYQTLGASTTRFQYDGTDLIAEYDNYNNLLRRFVHGPGDDKPILWYEGTGMTTKRYLTSDERGSVVAITDGSGALFAKNSYDEYGIPAASNTGRFQYTGQTWVPEIGMYYYKARMYSPTLGRFMQTDPIGYRDGMNWYTYVGADPVNMVDSTGLEAMCPADQPDCITVSGRKPRSLCEDNPELDICNMGKAAWDDLMAWGDVFFGPEIVVTANRKANHPTICEARGYQLGQSMTTAGDGLTYAGIIGLGTGNELADPLIFAGGALSMGGDSIMMLYGDKQAALRFEIGLALSSGSRFVVPSDIRGKIGDEISKLAVSKYGNEAAKALSGPNCNKD